LHIKLLLIKYFIKALDQNGAGFMYCYKIREGLFVGPKIRKLIQDVKFEDQLNEMEKAAWNSLNNVTAIFERGNRKAENYRDMVANLVQSYKATGYSMSVKVHFLDCQTSSLKTSTVNDEHGERFHQDISTIERRYQCKRSPSLLADYSWTLRRDVPKAKSSTVTF
jgi:hypothetical protein